MKAWIIKPDALPIDNITKFAYTPDDYTSVEIADNFPDSVSKPTVEERLSDIELALADIYGGVI